MIKIRQDKSLYKISTTLFTTLAAVGKRSNNEERFFDFELTTEPMSLFKQGIVSKPNKPALQRASVKEIDAVEIETIKKSCDCVIDESALLCRVCWVLVL